MQRDYWYAVNRTFAKLESPDAIGKEAARRTLRRLGAKKVTRCSAPVIFEQEVAGSLLGHLCSALSGYALYGWRKAKGQRASMISTSTDEPEESGLHR